MYTYEVCAANLQSALAAHEAGAHRIELCSALEGGGITPSPGLLLAARRIPDLRVCLLIRPREGDFCFSAAEVDLMVADVLFCRDAGIDGVVVGALTPDGRLDVPVLEALRDAAGDMEMVCHRAFDFTRDPAEALETLIELGFRRVLSSGQATTAYEGRELLARLVAQAAGRITVMPGAGISPKNIRVLADTTGATEFHFTARQRVEQQAGHEIVGLETGFWASGVEKIRETMAQLEKNRI